MKNLLLITTIILFVGLQGPTNAQWFAQNVSSQNNLRDIFALDENTAIAVGNEYTTTYEGIILKTIDGGENWVNKSNDSVRYNNSVCFINADTGWIAGGNGGGFCFLAGFARILKTTDAGDTWMSDTIGFADGVSSVHFVDQNTGWVVGTCYDGETTIGRMHKTTDGGINWNRIIPYPLISSSVFFINIDTGWVAGYSILKSTDGGNNWTSQLDTLILFNSVYFVDEFTGWAAGREVFLGTHQGVILKTTNGGENWENQSVGVSNWLSDIYFVDENTGWAVGEDGIILNTTDGGENWISQPSATINNLSSVHFIDENTGWVVGANGTILKTTNGGIIPVELTSFTAIAQSDYVELKWTTATELNNLGFEIERKIIKSDDNGEWSLVGFREGYGTTTEPREYSFVDDIEGIIGNSFSYRLKQIDFDGTFEYSNVVEVDVPVLTEFALDQNYPNPFNPTTTISYSLPLKSQVELAIYNALGESVMQLVNEEKPAGSYSVEFDAANLPSGVYFYQLKAGDFIQVKKMIIIK
ncbi:YCF48-related protein [Bacteroidota bacterium]